MRSFKTGKQFQITTCDAEAVLLVEEHLDAEFTIDNTKPTRDQLVEYYRRFYRTGRTYVETVPTTMKF